MAFSIPSVTPALKNLELLKTKLPLENSRETMSSYKEAKRRCVSRNKRGRKFEKRLFVLSFFSDFDFDFDDLAASQLQSADLGLVELDHPAEKILTWD